MSLKSNSGQNAPDNKKIHINTIKFLGILLVGTFLIATVLSNISFGAGNNAANANTITNANPNQINHQNPMPMRSTTQAMRKAGAKNLQQTAAAAGVTVSAPMLMPGPSGLLVPDYFGMTPNFALSPLPPDVIITGDGTGATGLATVQAGVVTAVKVTNGGSGYTSANVAITGMDGLGAIALATITGPVTALTLTNGGNGYTSTPLVTIASPSAGITATATANVAYDIVSAIAVTASGNGYTAPIVTITPTTGTQATATATGVVDAIPVTNGGSGYTSTPTVTIIGGGATTDATATALVDTTAGIVTSITVDTPGAGYTSAPTVTITGGGATTDAIATATLTITGITITNSGSGYSSVPLVNIADGIGTGTGATAAATVSGAVTGLFITNSGSGYTSAPGVTIESPASGIQATATATITGPITAITVTNGGSGYGGIRKFVDSLPDLTAAGANNLGNYLPVAIPDITTYPNTDYYEIELNDYTQKLHSDLAPTKLRGYKQTNAPNPADNVFKYLGPVIVAQKDRPVRIKFTNKLLPDAGGNLFLPVDPTVMGAGMYNINWDPVTKLSLGTNPNLIGNFAQNRATLHLHGGDTPWISDGTQHQWITPAGDSTTYPKGVSVAYVPDMWFNSTGATVSAGTPGASNNPGAGSQTFYYTNGQSARLMFYHDHAYGITRLNVYAGEAAGYLEQDPVEQALVTAGTIPSAEIPLIIQDKTFVPGPNQLAAQDPTWDSINYGGFSNLWLPHVYMPNQNPESTVGANPMGRWDYGPWFWPVFPVVNGQLPNPYYDPVNAPWEPSVIPGIPNPSIVPEAFADTPLVNGVAYPNITVEPKAYRLRILNAANDRFFNLQLYQAKSSNPMWVDGNLSDENAGDINMVPFNSNQNMLTPFPDWWYTPGLQFVFDDRAGGVPDPTYRGPAMIQIGTEGGFLPAPAVIRNQPINFVYNRRDIVVLNVLEKALFLGPAERADVIVDFSKFAGKTLILYNDASAPVPANDPRNDYYTGDMDQTDSGGAPTTLPGYGPNTRTIMQIKVSGSGGTAPVDDVNATLLAALKAALPVAYSQTQGKPLVPQAEYNATFGANYPVDAYARIQSTNMTFQNGGLANLKMTNGGAGYTVSPIVTFNGGGGTGAAGTATLAAGAGTVAGLNLLTGGSGYTTTPTVSLSGGGGTGAAGTATLAAGAGTVASLNLLNGGSNYNTAPTVTLSAPATGTTATATATLAPRSVLSVTITNGGSGYTTPPQVIFNGGGGSGAIAVATIQTNGQRRVTAITVTNGGTGYTSVPTVTFSGGGGTGAAATAVLTRVAVAGLTLTNPGSGYTIAPTVTISGGGGTGATANSVLKAVSVASLTLTNPGSGYNSAPTVTISGGGGTGATANSVLTTRPVVSFTLTNAGYGYTSAPTVTISGGGGSGASATVDMASITMNLQPKAIQELFDPEYGRMNSLLGVEIPMTSALVQTTIPYADINPPTELFNNSVAAVAIGTLEDGTQIWKITHNGVDTHAIHWHMFNVQVINRVGWDGAIRAPDANELGWKDTVRMNPLEDIIVAMRPIIPVVPFELPNSIRPMDVTAATGTTAQFGAINGPGMQAMDPYGFPAPVTNSMVNFGWEYVWHCHLLGHEENIMMRSMIVALTPRDPIIGTATRTGPNNNQVITLTWTDNSTNEISWIIQSAPSASGPWTNYQTVLSSTGPTKGTVSYTTPSLPRRTTFYFRVIANNVVGYTQTYAPPAVGYPTITKVSGPSAASNVVVTN
ncbi:MAG: hypothetical protein OIN87_04435 [Candidatus Methanoperedens sp.]|nr:hypothetical protein [Candidatus Methanoperedens sp.]